jgi:hypothetical protein
VTPPSRTVAEPGGDVVVYYRLRLDFQVLGAAARSSGHISDHRSFGGWWETGGGNATLAAGGGRS